jgi:hypothetical protein
LGGYVDEVAAGENGDDGGVMDLPADCEREGEGEGGLDGEKERREGCEPQGDERSDAKSREAKDATALERTRRGEGGGVQIREFGGAISDDEEQGSVDGAKNRNDGADGGGAGGDGGAGGEGGDEEGGGGGGFDG